MRSIASSAFVSSSNAIAFGIASAVVVAPATSAKRTALAILLLLYIIYSLTKYMVYVFIDFQGYVAK
jgi:hypothetical protein